MINNSSNVNILYVTNRNTSIICTALGKLHALKWMLFLLTLKLCYSHYWYTILLWFYKHYLNDPPFHMLSLVTDREAGGGGTQHKSDGRAPGGGDGHYQEVPHWLPQIACARGRQGSSCGRHHGVEHGSSYE